MGKEVEKVPVHRDKSTNALAVIVLLTLADIRTDDVPKLNLCEPGFQSGTFKDINDSHTRTKRENTEYSSFLKPLSSKLKQIPDSNKYLYNVSRNAGFKVGENLIIRHKMEKAYGTIQKSNVLIEIKTADYTKPLRCNGVHIGGGRIATAAHCFGNYAPSELAVSITDSAGNKHEAENILKTNDLDAAIISTDEKPYPDKTEVADIADKRQNQHIIIFARDGRTDSYAAATYAGGYKFNNLFNCSTGSTFYEFGMFTDKNIFTYGHSGGGIYNPDNGELVGVITAVSAYSLKNTAFLLGTRAGTINALEEQLP